MAIYRKGRPKGYVRTGLNDGFLEKEWEKLPDKAKRKLLKLMVRISDWMPCKVDKSVPPKKTEEGEG